MKAAQIIERARREGIALEARPNGVVQCRGQIRPDLVDLLQANSDAVWDALMEVGGSMNPPSGRKVVDFESERAKRRPPTNLRDRVRGRAVRDEPYLGPEGDAA